MQERGQHRIVAFAPVSPASTLAVRVSSAWERSAVMVKESTISSA